MPPAGPIEQPSPLGWARLCWSGPASHQAKILGLMLGHQCGLHARIYIWFFAKDENGRNVEKLLYYFLYLYLNTNTKTKTV
jgi:hypothetical protein